MKQHVLAHIVELLSVCAARIGEESMAVLRVRLRPQESFESINLALTNPATTNGAPVSVSISGIPSGWTLNEGENLGNGTWSVSAEDLSALITYSANDAGIAKPNEVTPDALRHTYLAFLVRQGLKLSEIRRVAGRLFDFNEMARRTLARHWTERTRASRMTRADSPPIHASREACDVRARPNVASLMRKTRSAVAHIQNVRPPLPRGQWRAASHSSRLRVPRETCSAALNASCDARGCNPGTALGARIRTDQSAAAAAVRAATIDCARKRSYSALSTGTALGSPRSFKWATRPCRPCCHEGFAGGKHARL